MFLLFFNIGKQIWQGYKCVVYSKLTFDWVFFTLIPLLGKTIKKVLKNNSKFPNLQGYPRAWCRLDHTLVTP